MGQSTRVAVVCTHLTCQLCTSQARAVGSFPDAFTEAFTDKWRHTLHMAMRIRMRMRIPIPDTDKRRHSFRVGGPCRFFDDVIVRAMIGSPSMPDFNG